MERTSYDIFVGTYTDNTGSGGIYRICVDSSGCAENFALAVNARNPSYLCMNEQMLYTVNEYEKGGAVAAYRVEERQCSEYWQVALSSGGVCHAYYSPSHDFIMLSGYLGGDYHCISAMDGRILSRIVHDTCDGIQPHAHCAITDHDGRFILCADLGLDTISSYNIREGKPTIAPSFVYKCKKGTGPRQMVFHPHMSTLFVVNELDNSVSSFRYDSGSGKLELRQNIPASGAGDNIDNYPAGIALDSGGKMLYVSNRGVDTIAAFKVLPTGEIKEAGEYPCDGEYPRHIMLTDDDRFLVISNQRSNNVVIRPVDPDSGSIGTATASLNIPAPSCTIEFARMLSEETKDK